MSKEYSKSVACAMKCLHAIMQYMKKNGGSIRFRDIMEVVPAEVTLTEWEKERAGKMQYIRWWADTQFYSLEYVKAGFIVKKEGVWYITPEGEETLKEGAEKLFHKAHEAYKAWNKENKLKKEKEEPTDTDIEVQETTNLEELESQARAGIKEHIDNKNPYEFQDMVAALLRAMGYYTPFVAPKGKDGGVDVIAYLDALGAKTPRIKVQVKHYKDTPIAVHEVRGLIGILRDGDIGLFVTSSTFSQPARDAAMTSTTYVKLIDGNDFIELWMEHYDKMSDEDKNMLPLKRIAFLGTNE